MSIDEKKAALTAAGYTMDDMREQVVSPDAWMLMKQQMSYAEQIDTAYAHWQQAQELAALRKLANELANYERQLSETETLYFVKHFRVALSIIDDLTHEDVSDLRHNRLDSLYDDDESSETDE